MEYYYVNGSGYARLAPNADIEQLESKLKKLNPSFGYGIDDDSVWWDEHDNYHEDVTSEFLNAIAPYIESGRAEYKGEDDALWRFLFLPEENEWREELGEIIYGGLRPFSDDDLIYELENRGYTVNKI